MAVFRVLRSNDLWVVFENQFVAGYCKELRSFVDDNDSLGVRAPRVARRGRVSTSLRRLLNETQHDDAIPSSGRPLEAD
jgi:hypothetical protein